MSLNSLLTQLGQQRPKPNGLEAQLDAMRRDVRRVGSIVARQAGQRADDWADHIGDFGREAVRHGTHLAEIAGTQAWRGAAQLRRDPLPAIAIIGTGLLLARLLRRN